MEADPSIEAEHYIAQKLSMTVARLRTEMSNDEFMSWVMYYQRIAQNQELELAKANGGRG